MTEGMKRRRTEALTRLAAVLMDDPDGRHWGYDTAKKARVRSATLYRLLDRLLADGWLEDGWEDPSTVSGRPPRRYYTVTALGRTELKKVTT